MATTIQQDRKPPQFLFLVPRRHEREAMNGLGARPNVYRRSLEARTNTNAYLAEVERRAAGVDEPVPVQLKRRAWSIAAIILLAVILCVGLWVL